MVRDLSELRAGDPVVHAQHGIGRYHGLVSMDMGEGEMEFLHLEYANGSTLYVPVSQLHVIARYSGADPRPRRCTSWAPASGTRPAARPPSRCATPPPSCWPCTRSAPRAKAMPSSCR